MNDFLCIAQWFNFNCQGKVSIFWETTSVLAGHMVQLAGHLIVSLENWVLPLMSQSPLRQKIVQLCVGVSLL